MAALAQLGERAEALRQYETLKATLQSELGVDPSPETLALRDRLTRDDAPAAGRSPGSARSEPSGAPTEPETEFVGREAERAALDAELAAVRRGESQGGAAHGRAGNRQIAAVARVVAHPAG